MLRAVNELYSVEDTPIWVKENLVPEVEAQADSPFNYPLVDYQEHISDTGIQSYRNTYQRVNDASRIEDASLLLTELTPGSQRMTKALLPSVDRQFLAFGP